MVANKYIMQLMLLWYYTKPILLNLEYYGKKRFPTTDLVALHCLKNRSGVAGLTRLKNNLQNGRFDTYESKLF